MIQPAPSDTKVPQHHIGSYALDDLLVNCCKEIMANGMDTDCFPETIKDWLAGKIFRSLPKRLVQKFLAFLMDDRDMTDHVGFRENQAGDEFTLMLYRSDAQKKRKEEQWGRETKKWGSEDCTGRTFTDAFLPVNHNNPKPIGIHKKATNDQINKVQTSAYFSKSLLNYQKHAVDGTVTDSNQANDHQTLQSAGSDSLKSSNNAKPMFTNQIEMTNDTFYLYADELVIDKPTVQTPTGPGRPPENYDSYNLKRPHSRSIHDDKITLFECYNCGDCLRTTNRGAAERLSDGAGVINSSSANAFKLVNQHGSADLSAGDHALGKFQNESDLVNDENEFSELTSLLNSKRSRYECPKCDSSYTRRARLVQHLTRHHADFVKARDLAAMFPMKKVNDNHRKIAAMEEVLHDVKNNKYICIICSQQFSTPRHTVRHVESVHRNMKEAECEICGKQLTDKKRLADHMLIHTGEKPFSCQYCGKQFRRKDKLQEHKRALHKAEYEEEKRLINLQKEQDKHEARQKIASKANELLVKKQKILTKMAEETGESFDNFENTVLLL